MDDPAAIDRHLHQENLRTAFNSRRGLTDDQFASLIEECKKEWGEAWIREIGK